MTRVLWLAVLVCVVQCLPMSQNELEDFSNFLLKTSSLDIHVKSADPDDSFDEEEPVSEHAWEESGKFEGDLILNDRQRKLIVENVEGLSRNGLTDSTKRWPNNEVIYFIQREHFTSGQVQAIQDGIDDLGRASCVKFRPYRKGDRDAVVIQGSRRGCFSQVGYQGGYQVLNLSGRHPVGRGCFRHGTVIHEMLHTLGFYHMQSSPDRDDYIDVVWSNIVQPARHNFRKYNSFSVSDFGVGYDYDSVLHYSRRAFSANGQDTLVPKKSGAQIGQRTGLSDKDTQKLNKMYCDADNDPAVLADEDASKKPKNKKKKPKNQPFEGHGIGYHQGKTVVIKLPAAEAYKLPNVPSIHVFDFSKTPQVVPPEAEGYRSGEEVAHLPKHLVSITELSKSDIQTVNPNKERHQVKDEGPQKEDNKEQYSPKYSNEDKPEKVPVDDYDKDLQDAFHRLSKIAKQHDYPQIKNYDQKINTDYSKFFRPIEPLSHNTDSFNEEYEQPTLHGSLTKSLSKQNDSVIIIAPALFYKSPDNNDNSQLQNKMDESFRTSLPTKKPYSVYEQTETPDYATLEYLKNRHDYSKIYSPSSSLYAKLKNRSENESTKNINYNHDIKINPYDKGLYTDYVKNDKSHQTDKPIKEDVNREKPNKYEVVEEDPKHRLKEIMEISYRTLLPTQKPYSGYEKTETPTYATLEYLKDRHDISKVYPSNKPEYEKKKTNEPYASFEDEIPTDDDWYNNDSYKHNPANYDVGSYSDYIQQKYKGQENDRSDKYDFGDGTDEDASGKTNDKYNAEDKDYNIHPYYEKESRKQLTPDEKYDSKNVEESSEVNVPEHKRENDYDYHAKYQRDETSDNSAEAHNDGDDSKESLNNRRSQYQDYFTDYEKEHKSSAIDATSDEDSKKLPKKSETYTLFAVPVPLSKNWFKISYN